MKWYIPDCYWNAKSNGDSLSHEAICVLNTGKTAAKISLTLYFEDREKVAGFYITVEPERTQHIRLDRLKNTEGMPIPTDAPYAVMVESEQQIYLQYTRVDSSQAELAIATSII